MYAIAKKVCMYSKMNVTGMAVQAPSPLRCAEWGVARSECIFCTRHDPPCFVSRVSHICRCICRHIRSHICRHVCRRISIWIGRRNRISESAAGVVSGFRVCHAPQFANRDRILRRKQSDRRRSRRRTVRAGSALALSSRFP